MLCCELGSRIRQRRQSLKMSQSELAGLLNVTPQAVSKWECGANAPDLAVLASLASHLCVSTDWLMGVNMKPALAKCALFQDFTHPELCLIGGLFSPRKVKKGEYLYRKGQGRINAIFIVESGTIQTYKHKRILFTHGFGEMFTDYSVADGQSCGTSARALEASVVLAANADKLFELGAAYPGIGMRMYQKALVYVMWRLRETE